ncbi:MAG: SOUL family heme-binding protein [Alphaproteobacteria bacterium]
MSDPTAHDAEPPLSWKERALLGLRGFLLLLAVGLVAVAIVNSGSPLDPGAAPAPEDPRVRLVEVPAETLAVLRFSGRPSDARVAEKTDELMAALDRAGVDPAGRPQAFFYDPPWTLPPLRRNEVAVAVATDPETGADAD